MGIKAKLEFSAVFDERLMCGAWVEVTPEMAERIASAEGGIYTVHKNLREDAGSRVLEVLYAVNSNLLPQFTEPAVVGEAVFNAEGQCLCRSCVINREGQLEVTELGGFSFPPAEALEAESQKHFEQWDEATGQIMDDEISKVYISGPMTGYENFNREAFDFQAARFKHLGYAVMNPAVLGDGFSQKDYMMVTVAMLQCCDCVVVLPGWEASKGTLAEVELAKKLELAFIYI